MKKSKSIGVILLFAFIGILAIPLLAAPAAPHSKHHESNLVSFEIGDEHATPWLICSISESDEFNARASGNSNGILLFTDCINYHSNIHKVRFTQTKEQTDIKLPKERIYLSNSCFTI